MNKVNENKIKRFKFLKLLYEKTNGSESYFINMWDIGKELGFNQSDVSLICEYLEGENLIQFVALGGGISITHWGIIQVEQAISEPENPTTYFPPVINIINVQSMNNSQIQQGNQNSTQTLNNNYNSNELASLQRCMNELKQKLSELNLKQEEVQEASAEINTVLAQLSSNKPKSLIINESLKTLRNLLEGTAASLVASGIWTQLTNFIH